MISIKRRLSLVIAVAAATLAGTAFTHMSAFADSRTTILIGDLVLSIPATHKSDGQKTRTGSDPDMPKNSYTRVSFPIEKTFKSYSRIGGHVPQIGFIHYPYEKPEFPWQGTHDKMLSQVEDLEVRDGFYVHREEAPIPFSITTTTTYWYLQQNPTLRDAKGAPIMLRCHESLCASEFMISPEVKVSFDSMNSGTLKTEELAEVLAELKSNAESFIVKRDVQ